MITDGNGMADLAHHWGLGIDFLFSRRKQKAVDKIGGHWKCQLASDITMRTIITFAGLSDWWPYINRCMCVLDYLGRHFILFEWLCDCVYCFWILLNTTCCWSVCIRVCVCVVVCVVVFVCIRSVGSGSRDIFNCFSFLFFFDCWQK